MVCLLGVKKTGILLLSMAVLVTSVFLSIPPPITCANCDLGFDQCTLTPQQCEENRNNCRASLQCPDAVGGEFIGIKTTSVLAAGAQYTAAWMIPVIVSAIGIGIVIARKF